MSSANEDAIPGFSLTTSQNTLSDPATSNVDSDSEADSDAAPDYRFLVTTTKGVHKLPSRGTKDFEPNATNRQQSTLNASRQAMYDALSVLRVHSKNSVSIGQYFPDEEDWDGARFDEVREGETVKEQACYDVEAVIVNHVDGRTVKKRRRIRKSGALKVGEGRCVAVQRFTHTYGKSMGAADKRNWTWLLPEEALFLLERGSLDIRWPDTGEDDDNDELTWQAYTNTPSESELPTLTTAHAEQGDAVQEELSVAIDHTMRQTELKVGKLPMSLQGAYACLIGKSGLTLERYTVYANLRRAGYLVLRAPTWTCPVSHGQDSTTEQSTSDVSPPSTIITTTTKKHHPSSLIHLTHLNPFYLLRHLFKWLFAPSSKPATTPSHNTITGPLISPGIFRNYFDIYRQLHLIPSYDYPSPSPLSQNFPDRTLHPCFHIHKPSVLPTFRKSSPPPPTHHLLILNARTTSVPTSSQLDHLLAALPDHDPPLDPRKRLETRIKHGKRSFLLAVVDCGIVSYMRVSAGGFARENVLWMENERRERERGRRGGFGGVNHKRGGFGGRGRGRGKGRHRA